MDEGDSASGAKEQSPVIAAASDRLVDYLGGFKTIAAMVGALMEEMAITVPSCSILITEAVRNAADRPLTPDSAQ